MQDQNQNTQTNITNPAAAAAPKVSSVPVMPSATGAPAASAAASSATGAAAVKPAVPGLAGAVAARAAATAKPATSATGTTNTATAGVAGATNSTAGVAKATPMRAATPSKDVFIRKIVEKIRDSENILVALSRDPSVDEMAAAIGLTLFLDGMQKHTTAIYSGQTPDALGFLQPGETFETNTDSLQDFIIALNKDKADHLRYKLDGDFVKVYITPYKTTISENDLEFSHGDYNVDLVLALGVPTAADLDDALAEYGRIMHDAMTVDITIDAPGKFGEIEWSDPGASSVCEMVTKLIFAIQGQDAPIDKDIATALLTGIVAATGRFSNDRTSSETMQIASKLMSMGADQQLISAHVMDNDSNNYTVGGGYVSDNVGAPGNNLLVGKDYGNYGQPAQEKSTPTIVTPEVSGDVDGMAVANATMASITAAPNVNQAAKAAVAEAVNEAVAGAVAVGATGAGVPSTAEKTVAGATGATKDYAQMMAQALAEPVVTPVQNAQPLMNHAQGITPGAVVQSQNATPSGAQPVANPNNAGVTLPPAPDPQTNGSYLPPVLPPVQGA